MIFGDGRSPAFPKAGLPGQLRKPGFRKSLASACKAGVGLDNRLQLLPSDLRPL